MTDKPADTAQTSPRVRGGRPDVGGAPAKGPKVTTTELPAPYARCGVCGGTYRPGSAESTAAHQAAQGHPPRLLEAPPQAFPHERDVDRVTVSGLLVHAAATVGQLQAALEAEHARLELLDQLATGWADTDSGDLQEAARMLRGVLARPAVFAQAPEA